jgi:hypothetical protein
MRVTLGKARQISDNLASLSSEVVLAAIRITGLCDLAS